MNTCPQCGTQAPAGQNFCNRCGSPLGAAPAQPPQGDSPADIATSEMTGRSCPYCRFPLKQGVAIAECSFCSTVHHAECWQENGGCCVTGCAGGPTQATQAYDLASAPPPSTPQQLPQTPAIAAAAQSRGKQIPVTLAAALAVVLAILGAAAALALSSGKSPTPAAATLPPVATTEDTQSQATYTQSSEGAAGETETATQTQDTETESDTATETESDATTAAANESQTESPLGAVNEHWHDIQTGNYQGAWADETRTLGGGESSWVHGQEEAGIESVSYDFEQTAQYGNEATVEIVNLSTVSKANGCQHWTGSYQLIDNRGSWQIADASSLQSHRC